MRDKGGCYYWPTDAHEMYASVQRGSHFGPAIFLLPIKYLPKNKHKPLVTICVRNIAVYSRRTKIIDNHNAAANLSADLALTTNWERNSIATFSVPTTKLVTCNH